MTQMYMVISNGEGDTSVRVFTEEELKHALAVNYWGDVGFVDINDLKDDPDTNYWCDKILIIKGEIVLPKPIEVVTAYQL